MLSIQKRILELEAFVTANQLLPICDTPILVVRKFHEYILSYWYIERRWSRILEENDTPRVKRLIALIYASNMSEIPFCTAMGRYFFFAPSADCWIPPLKEFKLTPEEIEFALQLDSTGPKIDLHFQHKCVTDLLTNMKAYDVQ